MTNWTIWILASAFFLALYDLAKKASVKNNAVLPVLLCSTSFGCAAFVSTVALRGDFLSVINPGATVLLLSAAKALIVSISWIFTFKALSTLPISIATPIRASAPALVFLVALFLYGEVPGLIQALGMLLVFAGYFAFSWAGKHEGIDFFRSHAVWCAFAGAFFSAVSSLFDKYVFQVAHAPIEATQFWFQVFLVLTYGTFLLAQRLLHLNRHTFQWRWTIPFVGILLAAADWLYFNGLSLPNVPVSACSLLRRFSVVITFILGAKLFHETNLLRKAFALSLIICGVILLCIKA
jgi:bacterial/archaeal transporter family protein